MTTSPHSELVARLRESGTRANRPQSNAVFMSICDTAADAITELQSALSQSEARERELRDELAIKQTQLEHRTGRMLTLRARTIEECAQMIDNHKVDASFDDSIAATVERNALLSNIARDLRALAHTEDGEGK